MISDLHTRFIALHTKAIGLLLTFDALTQMKMKTMELGIQGLTVPVIGLGCMGMTGFEEANMYGPADEKEAIATIHRSLELGGNFLDTADLYGPFKNEQLISKAIAGNRDKYIIATKFGWEINMERKIKVVGTWDHLDGCRCRRSRGVAFPSKGRVTLWLCILVGTAAGNFTKVVC